MSRADGQAPWTAVPHTVYERWVLTAGKPFPEEDAVCDFDHLTRCAIHRGHEMPSARALAARWGWSADRADRLARRLRKPGDPLPSRSRAEVVRRSCGGGAEVVRQSEPENVGPIVPECGGDAEVVRRSCGGRAEHVAGNEPVQALLLAPKNQEENNQEEHTSKPAKAGAVDLQALLDEMHAMELAVRPTAQAPRLSTYEKSIRRTLEGLKDRAREEASTPRALMMAAWTWWWTNPEGWHRTALHGARGYRAFFQHAHVKHYLDRMRDEAATAPASPAAAPPKPKSPGEVAWDRWMEGLDAARAWYAANKGTREGDAFHAAMEAACKPNPIAELFGGYMDNPKERRIVREVFVSEYERRTAPLRLVAR